MSELWDDEGVRELIELEEGQGVLGRAVLGDIYIDG